MPHDQIDIEIVIPDTIALDVSIPDKIEASLSFPNSVVGEVLAKTYNWPMYSGDGVSSRTGDDADIESTVFASARVAGRRPVLDTENKGLIDGWFFLKEDNVLGNKQRFTDTVGGTAYAANGDYFIDHYTGLGWETLNPNTRASGDWNPAIDAALAATVAGFTDLFLPSLNQLLSINSYATLRVFSWTASVGYALPLSYLDNDAYWTSTMNNNVASQIQSNRRGGDVITRSKTTNAFHHLCRKHF